MKTTFVAVLAAALLAIPPFSAFMQDQELLPDRTKQPEFQQRIAVNYILVDVVVTDRDGNYVRNLTLDDFELYEDGKPVKIDSLDEYQMFDMQATDFQQMSPDEMYLKQPPRNIIIFFDMLYSSSYGIKRAVEMAEKFVLDRLQPGDYIMVLAYKNSLITVQPFTSDKTKVIEAMRKVGLSTSRNLAYAEAPAGTAPAIEPGLSENQLFSETEEMGARILEAEADHQFAVHNASSYLRSMEALAKTLKYYAGRKTMILLSEGLNYDLLDPSDRNQERFGPLQRQQSEEPMVGVRPGVSLMPDYKDMVEVLNDAKVSLYTVNVGGLKTVGDATQQYGAMDQLSGGQDVRPELTALSKRQEFLSGVAVDTGGRAYYNTNNILKLLNQVEVDVSNYYILGYRSEFDPIKSKYRNIKVKAKNPAYRVLHRKGFFTPRPFASLDADERDLHLTEGFLTRNEINDLEADVGYQFIRVSPDSMRACICITVPTERMEIDKGKISLEILASNIDSEGKIFSSVHKEYEISGVENAGLAGRGLRVVETLDSVKGVNKVRIALRDNNTGKLSYFYYNYMFRESEPDKLLVSQPFFYHPGGSKRVEDEFQVKTSVSKLWNEPPSGGAVDSIRHPEQGKIFPEKNPQYSIGDTVNFVALLYNVRRQLGDPSEIEFQYALSPAPEEGEERGFYGIEVSDQEIFKLPGVDGIVIVVGFTLSDIDPGVYDLYLLAGDTKTGRKSMSASPMRVIE
jgi:VWFA-related protein